LVWFGLVWLAFLLTRVSDWSSLWSSAHALLITKCAPLIKAPLLRHKHLRAQTAWEMLSQVTEAVLGDPISTRFPFPFSGGSVLGSAVLTTTKPRRSEISGTEFDPVQYSKSHSHPFRRCPFSISHSPFLGVNTQSSQHRNFCFLPGSPLFINTDPAKTKETSAKQTKV